MRYSYLLFWSLELKPRSWLDRPIGQVPRHRGFSRLRRDLSPIALGAGVSEKASGLSSHRRPIIGPVAQLVRAHA